MKRAEFGGSDRPIVSLTDALETSHVATNRYRVPSGEGLPSGLHAHGDQEEVFLVLSGVATFETFDGEVSVAAGEAVRFPPGEYQSCSNGGDETLVVLALGAPRGSDDVRFPATCRACGNDELRLDTAADDPRFRCPACDADYDPLPCPDCGSDDLRFTLDGTTPIVECRGCESTFENAPLGE